MGTSPADRFQRFPEQSDNAGEYAVRQMGPRLRLALAAEDLAAVGQKGPRRPLVDPTLKRREHANRAMKFRGFETRHLYQLRDLNASGSSFAPRIAKSPCAVR